MIPDDPELRKRLQKIYKAALKTAIKDQKEFLNTVQDVYTGKKKPPAYYVNTGKVDEWKKGFLRQAQRKNNVIANITRQLNAAGGKAETLIQQSMIDMYRDERNKAIAAMIDDSIRIGFKPNFAMMDRRAIMATIAGNQSPFSKIAYKNLGKNKRVVQRLQNEMAQAIALGQSRDKVIKRIKNVVGDAHYNAARTAQTESTRIRSQARYEATRQAQEMGLQTEREWHCRFNHSRQSHMGMEGQIVGGTHTPFISGLGNELLYPGDSHAPAADVINCHCYVTSRVKSASPTLAALREEQAAARQDWVMQLQGSKWANNWRGRDLGE